jgi:uracil-DNA glycosylase
VHGERSQRQEMDESSAGVSGDSQRAPPALARSVAAAALAAEAVRHLAWMEQAGVRELPPPPLMEPPAAPPSSRPVEGPAAEGAIEPHGQVDARPPDARPGDTPRATGSIVQPSASAAPSADGRAPKGCGSPGLLAIRSDLGDCTRCKLSRGRHHLVFGVGNPAAELVFVGEGPGEDEDLQGEPFVGRAGQLLTRMIEAMGFARADVYIANVVKCRPPGNRNPEPDEIAACEPFLRAQLAAIAPRVIVALGKFAAQTLLRDPTPISRLRGRWFTYQGVRLLPTFHPAYLLRSPDEKRKAWDDLQLVMRELGKPLPQR